MCECANVHFAIIIDPHSVHAALDSNKQQEKGLSPTEKITFLQSSSSISANDPLQSKLHSLKTQTLQTQATSGSSLSKVFFRDNDILVETKEARMALLKINELKEDWEQEKSDGEHGNKDAKFMALLSGYDDAISLANRELKQLATLKAGPAVNAKKFQLINLLGYCQYQKLRRVMGRNEDLARGILQRCRKKRGGLTLKHMEEVAHLYDALLQDGRAVAALPGGGSLEDDYDTAVSVEDEFLLEANANVLRLRALRCYYLAQMHAASSVHKYVEALALLDQAEGLGREAAEELGACERMEGGEALLADLEAVLEEMRGEKCRVLAAACLDKHRGSASDRCLLERLHDYDFPSSAVLAHMPPKLKPMACRPSFFDVASNYLSDYPADELARALEEHSDKKDNATNTGFLGWFRR